jgi:hypothetical protein
MAISGKELKLENNDNERKGTRLSDSRAIEGDVNITTENATRVDNKDMNQNTGFAIEKK